MKFGKRYLALNRARVMGILNVTPDSFSDGGALMKGRDVDLDKVLRRASAMVNEGASILDIGGESTRPGAKTPTLQEECDRVLPVIERLSVELDVILSVDTSRPPLMESALKLGVGLINDVRALASEGAIAALSKSGAAVCLMHMQGSPSNMQRAPSYQNVVAEVTAYLSDRVHECVAGGIDKARIIVDPGIGFGKNDTHNLKLIAHLRDIAEGLPILIGVSRKSLIGRLLGRDVDERLPASLALSVAAMHRGARIIRTHDVAATCDAVKMFNLLEYDEDVS